MVKSLPWGIHDPQNANCSTVLIVNMHKIGCDRVFVLLQYSQVRLRAALTHNKLVLKWNNTQLATKIHPSRRFRVGSIHKRILPRGMIIFLAQLVLINIRLLRYCDDDTFQIVDGCMFSTGSFIFHFNTTPSYLIHYANC